MEDINLQKIEHQNVLYAIIIRQNYTKDGIEFFTPNHFSQQLGYMHRKKGHIIDPHEHNRVKRTIHYTNEVLLIKRGKVRADFYDNDRKIIKSAVLLSGDVILLAFGGHGFEILEDAEIIEVKQGPYAGEDDKTRFEAL